MKAYPPNLFALWPGDKTSEQLPAGARVESRFRALYEHADHELRWIAATAKHIEQQEGEDVFDQLYRRNHVLAGFAAILGLPKVTHLLSILDFSFELARDLETFESHSLAYLVQLLIDTTWEVFQEFLADGRCRRDLSDVIGECKAYLDMPLQQCLMPPQPTRPGLPSDARANDVGEAQRTVDEPGATELATLGTPGEVPAAVAVDLDIDDAPEALDIPIDKIGLVSDFCEECRENLGQIGHLLVALEDSDDPFILVADLFRLVHSVKGGARLLNVHKMEALTHRLESLLEQVRQGTCPVTSDLIDVLLDSRQLLDNMVDEVASRGPIRTRIASVLQAMAALQNAAPSRLTTSRRSEPIAATPGNGLAVADKPVKTSAVDAKPRIAVGAESIRIPTEKLDEVLNTASEVFITRIRLQKDVAEIRSAIHQFTQTLHQLSDLDGRVMIDRLGDANRRLSDDLQALMRRKNGYLIAGQFDALLNRFQGELSAEFEGQGYTFLEEMTRNVRSLEAIRKRMQKNVEHLEQLSGRLQTSAMNFRMVPIAHLFDRFPTQVREIGRQVGKKVRLDISGADTELDKVLINQLADPLLHILRNAVDHGIESAEERQASGKPEVGRIALRAYYHGSHAIIEVSDDGRGVDVDKVLARALARGLVDSEHAAALTRQEVFALLFEPGFSTADQVSTLSGRGVGMDVVKTTISRVQGSITIDSVPTQGMTIRMKLPLTLAVVGILLVEERCNQFAFPILNIEEIITVDRRDIKQLIGSMVYNYRGNILPVTTLSSMFDFPSSAFRDDSLSMVILAEGEKKIGVLVDRTRGRQEVLIKNLGTMIKKVPFVMGCTILSDSRLVLILNVWEMVNARSGKAVPETLGEIERMRDTRRDAPRLA